MNILLLTQVLPYPLDAGPKVRAYYMLRHLSQQHQVTLVSFTRPDDRPEYVAHLRGIAAAVHTVPIQRSAARTLAAGVKGLLAGLPIAIARDEMPEMAALLRRLVAATRFDVIHADQLSMAGWGLLAAEAARRTDDPSVVTPAAPRLLLDEHNAIYRLTERMADNEPHPLRRAIMRREARAFRRYEAAMLRAYDAVLAVTEEDRALLAALLSGHRGQSSGVRQQTSGDSPHSPFATSALAPERSAGASVRHSPFDITVIPICVDPAEVAPVVRSSNHQSTNLPAPPTILHLGTMFWPPNVAGVLWFGREVLPRVWAQVPAARFVVVGKNPPPEVRGLAADPRIEVTGYVADPQPYLEAADAFVVPLHAGGGMRVKIVDAWLWGLPIVSTPIGAEGIAVQDGENIFIAPDAASFAAAVIRVLTDPALNQRLRVQGRRWVETRYNWRAVYQQVDVVYGRLLAKA